SFFSGVLGRSFLYISTVKSVEHELNTEANELISAANNPAATNPLKPEGSRLLIRIGKASSGESQCNSPRIFNVRAITPGIKNRNTGSNFNNAPKIVPLLPSLIFLAVRVRCTIYWSVHQYHIPTMVLVINKVGQGNSGSEAERHISRYSGVTVSFILSHPPTSCSPIKVNTAAPKTNTTAWSASVYITARIPPTTV